jgi:hypothetical protein
MPEDWTEEEKAPALQGGAMKGADVRGALEGAGLEIVAECPFSVIARGGDAMVHALEYPRGYRLSAIGCQAAIVAREPADVTRFCAALVRVGAR